MIRMVATVGSPASRAGTRCRTRAVPDAERMRRGMSCEGRPEKKCRRNPPAKGAGTLPRRGFWFGPRTEQIFNCDRVARPATYVGLRGFRRALPRILAAPRVLVAARSDEPCVRPGRARLLPSL